MSRETRNITTVPVIAAAPNTQPGPTRTSLPSLPHGLPQKPTFDMFAKPESTAPVMSPTSATAETPASNGVATVGETNRDVVSNRAAIRMANMSAAEALKAELHGLMPLGRNAAKPDKKATAPAPVVAEPPAPVADTPVPETPHQVSDPVDTVMEEEPAPTPSEAVSFLEAAVGSPPGTTDVSIGETAPDMAVEDSPRGTKRKAEDIEEDAEGESMDESDEVAEDAPIVKKSKTEEHDSIKLWTPGYQQRYYKSKFEFEWADREARHKITSSYVEGLCWVLHYYYQGTPSWQWFYPSHYAPFAGDFDDVATLSIQFKIGQPFKPFEQLMAVFPPASRKHIPVPYQELMTDENSPIIDFYPLNFEIDMNGKTQAWQGIALLPFIDEQRLLDAMKPRTAQLSKDEIRRNTWGSSSLLVSDQHPLYNFLCELYSKRKKAGAHTIDIRQSNGLAGMVVADSAHVPGATYESPLASIGLPDISNNRSISVLYYFPKQVTPHRSVLLPGAQPPPRRLDRSDIEFVRAEGRLPGIATLVQMDTTERVGIKTSLGNHVIRMVVVGDILIGTGPMDTGIVAVKELILVMEATAVDHRMAPITGRMAHLPLRKDEVVTHRIRHTADQPLPMVKVADEGTDGADTIDTS
ncbi:5'-3' exoribonuclease 2 [Tulasnella sp. 427]|nr:5'-3' exoribonuclease 2 [Tulasnella sp. 427]